MKKEKRCFKCKGWVLPGDRYCLNCQNKLQAQNLCIECASPFDKKRGTDRAPKCEVCYWLWELNIAFEQLDNREWRINLVLGVLNPMIAKPLRAIMNENWGMA